MSKNEIERRIDALKATATPNGLGITVGRWILLDENAKAKDRFCGAVPLRELLSISETAMVQHFRKRWRIQFINQDNGFIHRTLSGCTFVSLQSAIGESDTDVPNRSNIIYRGSDIARTIHDYLKKKVAVPSSSKEDGASTADTPAKTVNDDAMEIEEDAVTVDDLNGKVLQYIFNYLHVSDMKRVACVNSKWKRAVLDAVQSPEDYLASLQEDHIPITIEILSQQKEQETGLGNIFTLVRQNPHAKNAITDAAPRLRVAKAPTVDNCLKLLNHMLNKIEDEKGKIPVAVQDLARRVIMILDQEQQQQNEAAETAVEADEKHKQPQQQEGVQLKYYDNLKRVRTCNVQIITETRSCKPTSSTKIKQQYIRRVANDVQNKVTERLGVNDTVENRLKVFQQLVSHHLNGASTFNHPQQYHKRRS